MTARCTIRCNYGNPGEIVRFGSDKTITRSSGWVWRRRFHEVVKAGRSGGGGIKRKQGGGEG